MGNNIKTILQLMVEKRASDVFITADMPPSIKIDGQIHSLSSTPLTSEDSRALTHSLMTPAQQKAFTANHESNFAISLDGIGRFRVSAFVQRGHMGMVVRRIELEIPTVSGLGLPIMLQDLALANRGIVFCVGATGTGKSTSLAALIGHRNQYGSGHIVSVEDPIEFVHEHAGCIITQREVGIDTESYEVALKNTLRQAPNVILVGEIRTRKAMEHVVSFAETGHLVLTTLHANNTNQAIERILHFFPEDRHHQVLLDLSLNLRAVVAQQLVPSTQNGKRIPVVEVLLNTPLMKDLIAKGKVHKVRELIQRSNELGMQTFDQALYQAYQLGLVTEHTALQYADSENEVRLMVKLGHDNTALAPRFTLDDDSP